MFSIKAAQEAKRYLSRAFLCLPPYALGAGLMEVASNSIAAGVYEAAGMGEGEDYGYAAPLGWDLVGMNVAAMVAEAVALLAANVAVEKGWVARARAALRNITR